MGMEVNTKILNKKIGLEEDSDPINAADLKDAEALVQQVVGKRLVETCVVQVNEALLELLDQAQVKEQAQAKAQEQDRQFDSAEFSDESLTYVRPEEYEESRRQELEVLSQEIQRLLEHWQPQCGCGLSQDIQQLEKIYQKLLQDILSLHIHGEQAGIQADRINGLLLTMIDRLGKNKFPCLLHLLENYGDNKSADVLRASVLKAITGRFITPQQIGAARKQMDQEKQSACFSQAGQGKDAGGRGRDHEHGILYTRTRGNQVDTNRQYRERVWAAERSHAWLAAENKGVRSEKGFFRRQSQVYTISDIIRTERFISYITDHGNLYKNPAITANNEELLGFLLAASMVKVQVYSEYAGVSGKIAADVWNALERFFLRYIVRKMEAPSIYGTVTGKEGRPDRSMIQRIYYQVMELVQSAENPAKGLEKGLSYVCGLFLSKKDKSEAVRKRSASGFFSARPEEKDLIPQLKYGAAALDKDWKEFLKSIGQDNNALLQTMLTNCPWGILIEGTADQAARKKSGPMVAAALLAVAGLCVLAVAAVLLIRGGI